MYSYISKWHILTEIYYGTIVFTMKWEGSAIRIVSTALFVLSIFLYIQFYASAGHNNTEKHYISSHTMSFGGSVLAVTDSREITLIITPIEQAKQEEISSNLFLNSINNYRALHSKSDLIETAETCSFALLRSQEVSADFSHEGFESRRDSNSLPLPNWSSVVENIAQSGGNNPLDMWKSSPNHNENLLSDITYGCVRNSGDYYVFIGWKD